jgi:hydrogenase expression/formation protein HypE
MNGPSCPLPAGDGETITLAHGGGGRLTARLIETLFLPAFGSAALMARHDGAALRLESPCAFTTDSFVVKPLFFPGGDIGTLAVNGTVNDLAMCGARPRFLSIGLVLEEGFSVATLRRVVASMAEAARAAAVEIVTGDVKVVERGKADGLFINSSGVGEIVAPWPIEPAAIRPGDAVLLSGDIGRHGIAVMAAREDLGLESAILSDCAPLAEPVMALLAQGVAIRCLRDLTRGGLATALVEIAEASGRGTEIDEAAIPVREDVRAVCELLGLDPLYVANEGRLVAFVAPGDADKALAILRKDATSAGAAVIGHVTAERSGRVAMRSLIGGRRAVDMLSGEQLPRIC